MRRFLHQLIYALVLTMLLWLTAAAAQQPATGRQKAPRLTTDDVVRASVAPPSAESKESAAKPEDVAKADPAEPKAGQPKATEVKVSDEEASWRERVGKARQSARFRNDTAAELGQAGQRLTELRAQARIAADDAAQLIEYGKTKGFTESEGPRPTAEEGKPNEEYYRTQFTKLTEALESAQRRVQLYDNRVRDLSQQISTNSGGKDKNGRNTGGDSFYGVQLQKDREEAQQKLEEARAAQTQAQTAVDALMEEARRAGVPPGLFR